MAKKDKKNKKSKKGKGQWVYFFGMKAGATARGNLSSLSARRKIAR